MLWYEDLLLQTIRTKSWNLSRPHRHRISGNFLQHGFHWKCPWKKHSIESPKVLGGTRKGLCLCRTTAAHSHRKAGLLYRSGVLQPHPKMFRADWFIDRKDHPWWCKSNGYVYPYVRWNETGRRRQPDHRIVLCSDTDGNIARYPVMHGSKLLFATKYKLYLPTEEELWAEVET